MKHKENLSWTCTITISIVSRVW